MLTTYWSLLSFNKSQTSDQEFMEYLGEFMGIATAMSWTATALFFQVASRRIGSTVVNILRLLMAFVMYAVYTKVFHGIWFPQVSLHSWTYLGISALIGYVLGDFFLFRSYEYISSRTSMLIMSLAPPISAFVGWLMLGERLTAMNFFGMILVLGGVSLVILKKQEHDNVPKKHAIRGVLFATLGAVGQGVGSVFSKVGMGDTDPFIASQVRVIVGIIGFVVIITFSKQWHKVVAGVKDRKGLVMTGYGAFFGPFLGVGLSMVAFQMIPVGIASTLMATMPIFILAPAAFLLKEKVTIREIIGAFIAFGGMLVFFL